MLAPCDSDLLNENLGEVVRNHRSRLESDLYCVQVFIKMEVIRA